MSSKLDADQVLKQAFDDSSGRIKVDAEVTATLGTVEVVIDQANDSIKIGDGTNLVTSTTVGPKQGLDVNVINTNIPASQSGTWNINNVSGTVSLPTGASTSANQTTGNTSLSSIDGKLNSLGQKIMSGSIPVTIASDQSALPNHQGRTSTGTIQTSNQNVQISCDGLGTVIVDISGTWAGDISFELTLDGSNWYSLTGGDLQALDGQLHIDTSTNGQYVFPVAGLKAIRLRVPNSSTLTGPANIVMYGSIGSSMVDQILAYTFIKQTDGDVFSVAGRYNYTLPTVTNGSRNEIQIDSNGKILTSSEVLFSDSSNIDAFGRLRISNPNLIFESVLKYDKQPLTWDESITGAATSTFVANESSIHLNLTTASGDQVVRQTKNYFAYHPGRSQLIHITGNMGGLKTNVQSRIGYFDTQNGLFFQTNGTNISVVQRSYVTGSPVDTVVNQSSWNLDKLDGTGLSGITLDISKQQIFIVDIEWLGSGRVRMGFQFSGKIIYCHEFLHSNITSTAYMTTCKLPVRYEITNTGTAASGTTMIQTCSSVVTEGGNVTGNIIRTINNGTTFKTANANNRVPLISLRLASSFNKASIVPLNFNILLSNTPNCLFEFIFNGSLTGASFVAVDGYGEADVSATAVTNGTVISSGYISGSNGSSNLSETDLSDQLLQLCSNLSGVSDIFTIAITPFINTTGVASFAYREIV